MRIPLNKYNCPTLGQNFDYEESLNLSESLGSILGDCNYNSYNVCVHNPERYNFVFGYHGMVRRNYYEILSHYWNIDKTTNQILDSTIPLWSFPDALWLVERSSYFPITVIDGSIIEIIDYESKIHPHSKHSKEVLTIAKMFGIAHDLRPIHKPFIKKGKKQNKDTKVSNNYLVIF